MFHMVIVAVGSPRIGLFRGGSWAVGEFNSIENETRGTLDHGSATNYQI